MQTSPQLLTEILGVLGQIKTRIDSMAAGTTTTPGAAAASKTGPEPKSKETKMFEGLGLNLGDLLKDPKGPEKLKNTSVALKELSGALGPLSSGLIKFSLVPAFAKRRLKDFIMDLLLLGTPKEAQKAKTASEAMKALSEGLPKLAKGVFQFGIVEKMGLVKATSIGITSLTTALSALGNPATIPFVLAGAAALAAVGLALTGIAKVLKSIALVMLSFSASIVIMVGAIYFATKLFTNAEGKKIGPLAAIGIIAGSIVILAGGFALIGMLSPLIVGAGAAIAAMGIGMGLLGLGMLAFIISIVKLNAVTSSPWISLAILAGGIAVIGLMSLAFAGIGLLSFLIIPGAKAVGIMGIGMAAIGVGLLAIGGVFALLTKWGVDVNTMFMTLAKGIAILALTFAGVGLLSLAILPGTLTLFAISVSLALFGLSLLEINAVIKKLGGEKGLQTTTNAIATMVSTVISGVLKGITGSEDEGGAGINLENLPRIRKVKKAMKIFRMISESVSSFAKGLTAFAKVGQMREVTYDEKTGEPRFGKTIDVIAVGNNIVNTYNTFISTLVTGTTTLTKRQGAALKKLSKALTGPGGLISGVIQFAQALETYAKFGKEGKIFIPEYDENGNPKPKKTAIALTDIVTTIVSTFGKFATELGAQAPKFVGEFSMYGKSMKAFNEALMGSKKGLLGRRETPGILSGIIEFSNVLNSFAQYGSDNQIPIIDPETGKITGKVPINTVVTGIMNSMDQFVIALQSKIEGLNTRAKNVKSGMSSFTEVITSIGTLAEQTAPLDKLSTSLGALAANIGLLVDNISKLNTDKLDTVIKKASTYGKGMPVLYATSSTGVAPVSTTSSSVSSVAGSSPDWDQFAQKVGDIIAAKLVSLPNGEFQFRFYESDRGVLSVHK